MIHIVYKYCCFFFKFFSIAVNILVPRSKNEPTTVAKITAAATRKLQINDTQLKVNFAVQVVTDLNLTLVNKSRK